MDESKGTPRAVVLAALLHLGIVGFLALAVLPCGSYEALFEFLHLPAAWNPIACPKPIQLPGPPIEATLIGPTGAPPPKAEKVKPVPHSVPPPPAAPPPPPPTPAVQPPKLKTLPPPPVHPDVKDQERVVEDAPQKADDAKQLQEKKERQRQSELDAQAAKQKAQQQKINELFAKMDAAASATKQAESKARQAKQQMQDLKNAKDDGLPDMPAAAQRQTGQNGPDADLTARYIAAIQNAVTPNWLRPDNIPNAACVVHIVQIPGGQVVSAKVDPSCPYDAAGRRSVENAVLRTKTLPYTGFEKAFQSQLTLTFNPQ